MDNYGSSWKGIKILKVKRVKQEALEIINLWNLGSEKNNYFLPFRDQNVAFSELWIEWFYAKVLIFLK